MSLYYQTVAERSRANLTDALYPLGDVISDDQVPFAELLGWRQFLQGHTTSCETSRRPKVREVVLLGTERQRSEPRSVRAQNFSLGPNAPLEGAGTEAVAAAPTLDLKEDLDGHPRLTPAAIRPTLC